MTTLIDRNNQTVFRGRRRGRKLRPNVAKLLEDRLPELLIKTRPNQTEINPLNLFKNPIGRIWLEIGFGAGEHIAWQAKNNPNVGFIGCEPFINGVASLVRHSVSEKLLNIRIVPDDVRPFLIKLPDQSIDRLFVLFPDPWPKRKHRNRRIIQRSTLGEFHRILKPGAKFRIATDHPVYLKWIIIHLSNYEGFSWLARRAQDWRQRSSDWPQTRYELKAITEGRAPIFLEYRRI